MAEIMLETTKPCFMFLPLFPFPLSMSLQDLSLRMPFVHPFFIPFVRPLKAVSFR
jgi:hypothetical protein